MRLKDAIFRAVLINKHTRIEPQFKQIAPPARICYTKLSYRTSTVEDYYTAISIGYENGRKIPPSLPSFSKNSPMQNIVLKKLLGGLWHATHPDRFNNILQEGAILPEPNVPDSLRWKASKGEEFYPYVRSIGGVSLFDFDKFDPIKYSEEYPLSSWDTFVPFRKIWGCSVWIEIDRLAIKCNLISGRNLITKWKAENAEKHTIMPLIEAAHIGPLPVASFKQAFLVQSGKNYLHFYTF